jgi:hypothetical protein
MTGKSDTDIAAAQWARAIAQARGLDRALELYPEAVAAAAARGAQCLSPLSPDFSALTEPAATFDPAAVADRK